MIARHLMAEDPVKPEDDDQRLHREAAELLCRIADGDAEAFSELYDRFSGSLLALCLTMLADRAEAEDTLQEVMLIVWGRARLYDPALGKAVSWLMTVARNKCLDRIRSTKRKRKSLEKAREELVEPAHQINTNPLDSQEKQDWVTKALYQLPDKQRRAIELAFLKGYTQVEISELLDEPLGTIKARIRRGIIQIRGILDQDAEPIDSSGREIS